jgi:hypothetical protein
MVLLSPRSGLIIVAALVGVAAPVAAAPAWDAPKAIAAAKAVCASALFVDQWQATELPDRWEVTGINLTSLIAASVTIRKDREKPNGCSIRRGLVQKR